MDGQRLLSCDDQSLTLRAWSDQRGIGVEAIRTRLRLGWSSAQALEFEEGPRPSSSARRRCTAPTWDARPGYRYGRLHPLKLDGRLLTVQEWSNERGLPVERVIRRLNLGWSPEEALRPRKRVRSDLRMLTCAGLRQPLRQWCRERDLPEDRVRSRLRLGWSAEEALELIPRSGDRRLAAGSTAPRNGR